MSAAAAKLLNQPTELSSWVGEVKQLIEQGELGQAQKLLDAFRICHPKEIWPHILKAWLAVDTGAPRTALAETEAAMQSPLYPTLSEGEREFIQALRSRSETALLEQAEAARPQAETPAEAIEQAEAPEVTAPVEILPKRAITVKKLAFYLPQFHPIPENDEWWGEGFTEWNNVTRAKPLFPGHWQPRRPGPMGFYDLRVPATMNKQFALARRYGIDGFCFYYYWFNGKKLLEKPLEMLMAGETDPFPFCICWVNESWTRSWDGMSGEILIESNQTLEGTKAFIRDLEPVLKNKNYIRVDGRPLILVYCAQKLDCPLESVEDWRSFARESGIGELQICAVQSFGFDDPTPIGFDAAVEFPPHCVPHKHEGLTYCRDYSDEEKMQLGVASDFSGIVRDYEYFASCATRRPKEPYVLYKGCMLAWDNTARRNLSSCIFDRFSVAAYRKWLSTCIDYCQRDELNPYRDSFVFINAWNEWAEGSTLEPDSHFGYSLLNATRDAAKQAKWIEPFTTYSQGSPLGSLNSYDHSNIVIFGHDAHFHGAQMLLLNMVNNLVRRMGCKVYIFLLQGGELAEAYSKLGSITIISESIGEDSNIDVTLKRLKRMGYDRAILNTTVSGSYTKLFKQNGFVVSNLIHELPSLIRAYGLEETLHEICTWSDDIVFSSEYSRSNLKEEFNVNIANSRILPQGINLNSLYSDKDKIRTRTRDSIEVSEDCLIVIGCGFADFRKGIDIFIRVAKGVAAQIKKIKFIWVGRLDPQIESYLLADIQNMDLQSIVVITGNIPQEKLFEYLLASDIFLLTSREDPLPSVVMHAFDAGLPVIGFKDAGGFSEILQSDERGGSVSYLDENAMMNKVLEVSNKILNGTTYESNHTYALENFDPLDYLNRLLTFTSISDKESLSILQAESKVSVIIPNYNYKRYLGGRLGSILNQTLQANEIIFLDDCSSDGSIDYAREYLEGHQIPFKIIANNVNSGLVASQWKKGVEAASGNFLWIAEADDYCEPTFLHELCKSMHLYRDSNPAICFCESWMVDGFGHIGETYLDYHINMPELYGRIFESSFILGGLDFVHCCLGVANVIPNASACIISADLMATLDWNELLSFRFGADWVTYLRLASIGSIAYLHKPLNYHRRHQSSVINANLGKDDQIMKEVVSIQNVATQLIRDQSKSLDLKARSTAWSHRVFKA